MKKCLFVLLMLLILSACSQSKFDKSMRSGKDLLSESQYEEAIKMFDIALIEKPTDKDAQLLMEKSKRDLGIKKSKEILQTYQEDNKSLYDEYEKVGVDYNENELGLTKKIVARDKLKEIKNKALELKRKYNKYPEISEAHDKFIDAIDSSINLYDELTKVDSSQFKINQYKKIKDDYLQKYKDNLEKIKNG